MNIALQSALTTDSFNVGSFDLLRQFMEHVVARSAAELGNGRTSRIALDWQSVEAAVADSHSLEQAIGRALIIAHQMCREAFHEAALPEENRPCVVATRSPTTEKDLLIAFEEEDPFFAFSKADAAPDFGDESRYRTKLAKKVARVCGIRRVVVTRAVTS